MNKNKLVFGLDVSSKNVGWCVLYNEDILAFNTYYFPKIKGQTRMSVAERLFKTDFDKFAALVRETLREIDVVKQQVADPKKNFRDRRMGTRLTKCVIGVESFTGFLRHSNAKTNYALNLFVGAVVTSLRIVLDELFAGDLSNVRVKAGHPKVGQSMITTKKVLNNVLNAKEMSLTYANAFLKTKGVSVLIQDDNTADAVCIALATEKNCLTS